MRRYEPAKGKLVVIDHDLTAVAFEGEDVRRSLGELYTKRFDFEDSVAGRRHLIMLRHPLGLKWSAYYGGMLTEIFDKGLGMKTEQTIGPESCAAKFEL